MIDNRRAVFRKSAERAASGPTHCRHVSVKKRLDRIARGGWRSKPVIDIPLVRRPRMTLTTCGRARARARISDDRRERSSLFAFLLIPARPSKIVVTSVPLTFLPISRAPVPQRYVTSRASQLGDSRRSLIIDLLLQQHSRYARVRARSRRARRDREAAIRRLERSRNGRV